MTIGDRIKELRNRLDMSQVDFACKINVSKQTLYKYENNIITNIPSDKIESIAKLGNVSPAYLMGWEIDTIYEDPNLILFDMKLDSAQKLLANSGYFVSFSDDNQMDVIIKTSSGEIIAMLHDYELVNIYESLCKKENLNGSSLMKVIKNSIKPTTIAAHKDGENFTPEEMEKIEEYKKLLIAARPKD